MKKKFFVFIQNKTRDFASLVNQEGTTEEDILNDVEYVGDGQDEDVAGGG